MSETHLFQVSKHHIDEAHELINHRINILTNIKKDFNSMCRGFSKHYLLNIILVYILITVFLIIGIVCSIIIPRDIANQFSISMDKKPIFITYYLSIWAMSLYFILLFGKRLFRIRSIEKAYLWINEIESIKDILDKYNHFVFNEKAFNNLINNSNNEIVSCNIDQRINAIIEEHNIIQNKLSKKVLSISIIVFYWVSLIAFVPVSSNLSFMIFYNNGVISDYDTYYVTYNIIMYFMLLLITIILTDNNKKLSGRTFIITLVLLVALIVLLGLYKYFFR